MKLYNNYTHFFKLIILDVNLSLVNFQSTFPYAQCTKRHAYFSSDIEYEFAVPYIARPSYISVTRRTCACKTSLLCVPLHVRACDTSSISYRMRIHYISRLRVASYSFTDIRSYACTNATRPRSLYLYVITICDF